MHQSTQVLVVGGGPAGSTAATLLALEGFAVTLFERECFPRYHIGESILPSCLPILDLTGAREKVEAHGFQRKRGAYFEWGTEKWELSFGELRGKSQYSWQVVRSEFDHILLEHAASVGVDVRLETRVDEVLFDGDRPVAARWSSAGADSSTSSTGELRFDFIVDASGRAGLLSTKYLKNRVFHDAFRNIGMWGYWEGVPTLTRGPEGAIAVCSIPEGWVWLIPLHDGTMSVGLVTSQRNFAEQRREHADIESFYRAKIARCPLAREVLASAALTSELRTEADYSYVSEHLAGPGYVLAGDAALFLDPLLSTGVHLAMFSAMLGAAAISSVLRCEVAESEAWAFYSTAYRHAYERLLVLVSTFYQSYQGKDSHFFEAQQLSSRDRQDLRLHESFLNIVSGMEDLADAQDEAFELVTRRLRGVDGGDKNPLANHNYRSEAPPVSPGRAVEGLYMVTEPHLGLRRAAADPVSAR